jgi:hypothetical protein
MRINEIYLPGKITGKPTFSELGQYPVEDAIAYMQSLSPEDKLELMASITPEEKEMMKHTALPGVDL